MIVLKTLSQVNELRGMIVLLRTGWDVTDEQLPYLEQTRIAYSFETIKYLRERGSIVVIITHRGRPDGVRTPDNLMKPVVDAINKQYKEDFTFIGYDIFFDTDRVKDEIKKGKEGSVFVLENIRFYKQEVTNDTVFGKTIASLGDIYVNDAFSVCHRENASVDSITDFIPSYAGLALEREIKGLDRAINPKKPSVAIFGGSKIETKLDVIGTLSDRYDFICCGSSLGKVFFHVLGYRYGIMDFDLNDEIYDKAREILKNNINKILLPDDVIVAKEIGMHAKVEHKKVSMVENDDIMLDIGPETIKRYARYIRKANTLLWNGPLGYFEIPAFKHGTMAIARLFGVRAKGPAYGVVGGGETLMAINEAGVTDSIDFVSTGGGAMLEYLYDQSLPGLRNLQVKE